jgi:hypothetical protein
VVLIITDPVLTVPVDNLSANELVVGAPNGKNPKTISIP